MEPRAHVLNHGQACQELILTTATGEESRTSGDLIASFSELTQPSVIIVEGPGGSGKTELLKSIRTQPLINSVYVDLSDAVHCDSHALVDYIEKVLAEWDTLATILKHSHIFLFDGLDHLLSRNLDEFLAIVTKKVLKCRSVLITTRAEGVNCLYERFEAVHHHYVLQGFSLHGMQSFFKLSTEYEKISKLLKHHRTILQDMCQNPFVCCQLLEVLKAKRAPLTLTEIVYRIILAVINKEIKKVDTPETNLCSLSRDRCRHFEVVSKLAFLDLVHGHKFDSLETYSLFLSSFSIESSVSSLGEVNTLNLMSYCGCDTFHASLKQRPYSFLSLVVRDFLAAFYLHLFPPLDQLYFLSEHAQFLTEGSYSGWLQFFFGLTVQREAEYNPTRMMMSSLNELLAYCLNFSKSMQVIIFIQSLTETREPSLWKKLAAKNSGFFNMSFSAKDIEIIDTDLVNLISSSGRKDWVMEVSPQSREVGENLRAYVTVNLEIKENKSLGDEIKLWPKIALVEGDGQGSHSSTTKPVLTAEQRIVKIGVFFCRAIREILQRVLQLYSRFKLKGDCSSSSYVSFYSCACFMKAVEEKVSFQPAIPSKFFPVDKASKKAEKKDSEITVHVREEHADSAVEMVILLRPCVKTVQFVLPSGTDELEIQLSGDNMPETSYELFVSSFIRELEEIVQCCASQEQVPLKTETVMPGMPINTQVSTVSAPISLPPATDKRPSSSTEHHSERDASTGSTTRIDSLHQPQALNYTTQESSIKGPSMAVSSVQPHSTHSSVLPSVGVAIQPVQQQSRRLATLKPGTVIFTSEPAAIPIDCVVPLPNESALIQSGGNGDIFADVIREMAVAVKKTSYRSKEYSIITKVRHENVIRLLAFVMGEENPAHKRRYFCYHVMPQMTGDLARMVTDHKASLLKNLHQTHVGDPHMVGLMCSKSRMILSCVLRGLAYLHSLHIAHRDVKASNVLLKLQCSCLNPILCSCPDKYRVVLCDFDAAVQLDVRNHLQPVVFSTSQTMQAIAPQYHCVPVGTNGFRAPECSMYTTANFPDGFSPPVSTQCDIFSFGLLCLRLMIGEEGPYRQRQVALLLLYYHQRFGAVEGRWRERRERTGKTQLGVSKASVEEILKLVKLRKEMNWFEHSLDLVQCCLKVNPQERPTASQLLLHPFFNHTSVQQSVTTPDS